MTLIDQTHTQKHTNRDSQGHFQFQSFCARTPESPAALQPQPAPQRCEFTPNHWPFQIVGWSCSLLGALFIAAVLDFSMVLLLGLGLILAGASMEQAGRHLNRQSWAQALRSRVQANNPTAGPPAPNRPSRKVDQQSTSARNHDKRVTAPL